MLRRVSSYLTRRNRSAIAPIGAILICPCSWNILAHGVRFLPDNASVQGCVIHLAAMLSDYGISPQAGALGSSVADAAVLLGRVGTGYLLD
jgi:hypothetical protein